MAARLQEAEELERNFLMTVSHELRTPLTAIRGHVEALREGVAQDERAARNRSTSSRTRPCASTGSLATSSTSPSSTRGVSRCCTRRSTQLLEQAYNAFAEEARRRDIDYRQDIWPGR